MVVVFCISSMIAFTPSAISFGGSIFVASVVCADHEDA